MGLVARAISIENRGSTAAAAAAHPRREEVSRIGAREAKRASAIGANKRAHVDGSGDGGGGGGSGKSLARACRGTGSARRRWGSGAEPLHTYVTVQPLWRECGSGSGGGRTRGLTGRCVSGPGKSSREPRAARAHSIAIGRSGTSRYRDRTRPFTGARVCPRGAPEPRAKVLVSSPQQCCHRHPALVRVYARPPRATPPELAHDRLVLSQGPKPDPTQRNYTPDNRSARARFVYMYLQLRHPPLYTQFVRLD